MNWLPFAYPEMLLLGLVPLWLYVRRLPHKNLWRLGALIALLLLLGYPMLPRGGDALDIFLVVDRSRSISDEGRAKQAELLELTQRNMQPGDRAAVVSFNSRAWVEQALSPESVGSDFQIPYSEDASDLSEGIATALGMRDRNRPARLLVLSDGEYTGRSPQRQAQLARQQNVPIFTRNLQRARLFNLSVREVHVPDRVLENEPFQVRFRVHSTVDTAGRYRIYRDEQLLGGEEGAGWRAFNFQAGENVVYFTDLLGQTAIHEYRIEVQALPPGRETLTRDNHAGRYVEVLGERPVLVVNNDGAPGNLAGVLQAAGIPAHLVSIRAFRLGANQLAGYQGVILNNVPLLDLSYRQIEALRDFVLQRGGGLLVSGGNRAFAKGGYYKSALDPILPVSLEDRQESRKVSTAFSIILDRSGSMAMPTASGETKMQLANHAAAECIRLLGPGDSVSVVAVDSQAHLIVPQTPAEETGPIVSRTLSIESMGGGIFTYTGLQAGASQVLRAPQTNKHILLFADAADAEEPGEYIRLLEDLEKVGCTVSVVGLGNETDPDADFLRDIAARGRGQVYFSESPEQLVQFFTADTLTYTRNSYIEDPVGAGVRGAASLLAPAQDWNDFSAAGYNLLFGREQADIALQTLDEDAAPLLAFWQRGLGRVAALAFDAEGVFSAIEQYPDIILSAARWVLGSQVEDNLQIDVDYQGSYARVRMEISDEERRRIGRPELQVLTPDGKTITRSLDWSGYNRLQADFKLEQLGRYDGVIRLGDKNYRLGPISLPVSPEFLHDRSADAGSPASTAFGARVLSELASRSGGQPLASIEQLFDREDLDFQSRKPLLLPLLIALIVLLVLEVAEERFGLLGLLRRRRRRAASEESVPDVPIQEGPAPAPATPPRRSLRLPRRRPGEPSPAAQPLPQDESAPAPDSAAGESQEQAPDVTELLARSKARARQGMAKGRRDKSDKKD